MKIIVDGDACPVKDEVIRVGKAFKMEIIVVVDFNHVIHHEGVIVVTVDQGIDSADLAIVNRTVKGDVVVTNDYGLASLVLSKGAYVIDANGREYTVNNIDQLLFERHLHKEIRMKKKRHKGPKKRDKSMNEHFENAFRKLLEKYHC